ncbi:MAG: lysylphosphatidylglycerol synthase transmembrane domain-containing protein [Acidimicrobiales bacterium]
MSEPPRRRLPRIRKEVRWTITIFVLFFVFEYLLLPELATARKSVSVLGHVNVAYLVLGFALEVLALIAYAELTHTVLAPESPSRPRILRINMASLAVSHVVPGGTAPGTAVGYRLLTDADVSGSTAGLGLATQGAGSALVLNAIFWLALIVSIPLRGFNPLYGIAAIAGVVLIAAFAGTIIFLTRGRTRAVRWIEVLARRLPFVNPKAVSEMLTRLADRVRVLLKDKALLRHAVIWAAANWLLDAASLWVFLFAFDSKPVLPIDLLVAYGLANILAVIPITPSGLGVVEGVLIPTLVGFNVPRTTAIFGVIGYRLINFWLPIPIGGASYLSLRWGNKEHRGRQRAAAQGDQAVSP